MAASGILNLKKVWRGEVPVRQVFFVWGVLANIIWQVSTATLIPVLAKNPNQDFELYRRIKSGNTALYELSFRDVAIIFSLFAALFFLLTLVFVCRSIKDASTKNVIISQMVSFGVFMILLWWCMLIPMMGFSWQF